MVVLVLGEQLRRESKRTDQPRTGISYSFLARVSSLLVERISRTNRKTIPMGEQKENNETNAVRAHLSMVMCRETNGEK